MCGFLRRWSAFVLHFRVYGTFLAYACFYVIIYGFCAAKNSWDEQECFRPFFPKATNKPPQACCVGSLCLSQHTLQRLVSRILYLCVPKLAILSTFVSNEWRARTLLNDRGFVKHVVLVAELTRGQMVEDIANVLFLRQNLVCNLYSIRAHWGYHIHKQFFVFGCWDYHFSRLINFQEIRSGIKLL